MVQAVRSPRLRSAARHHSDHRSAASDDWRRGALCAHESPDLFFPLGESEQAMRQAEEAKRVCRHCAVREECLDWALEARPVDGVFGGTDPSERRALLKRG